MYTDRSSNYAWFCLNFKDFRRDISLIKTIYRLSPSCACWIPFLQKSRGYFSNKVLYLFKFITNDFNKLL